MALLRDIGRGPPSVEVTDLSAFLEFHPSLSPRPYQPSAPKITVPLLLPAESDAA